MKSIRTCSLIAVALFAIGALAVTVGDKAPDFTGIDSYGKSHKLSDYHGKFVVLEWHNNGCPFTQKHYDSGNMQRLQKEWTDKGVVWFTVISSSPGAQGYVTADQENEYMQKMHAAPTAALLDAKGDIGHLYGAKTTPHMFVIDPQGSLIYNGAIDDKASTDPSDVTRAKNYVSEALQQAKAGQPVAVASTRPYGCSVKYAD
ncbi:MAG: thioredoxin family protein [Terriglobales bacterium]